MLRYHHHWNLFGLVRPPVGCVSAVWKSSIPSLSTCTNNTMKTGRDERVPRPRLLGQGRPDDRLQPLCTFALTDVITRPPTDLDPPRPLSYIYTTPPTLDTNTTIPKQVERFILFINERVPAYKGLFFVEGIFLNAYGKAPSPYPYWVRVRVCTRRRTASTTFPVQIRTGSPNRSTRPTHTVRAPA